MAPTAPTPQGGYEDGAFNTLYTHGRLPITG